MSRKIEFSVDEYYHVYNRGTDKREIFMSSSDKDRFVALLYLANSNQPFHFSDIATAPFEFDRGERLVDIGAYCLMPNHFHLLLREFEEGGLSQFMHRLSTGYTMYFNKKNERSGSLFENRFRALHVGNDDYLRYLLAYIHLNPIKIFQPNWREIGLKNKSSAKKFLNNYQYSSYDDYVGRKRVEGIIINRDSFPEYFSEAKDFDGFLSDWMDINSHEAEPRGK